MAISNWDLDELARSPEITGAVMRETNRIATIIVDDAPVESGGFKTGIHVSTKYQERSVGLVEATDPKSLLIEAKTGIMARAVKKAARKR